MLAEEFFVELPYAFDVLKIDSSFLPAPANNGDADISFTVEQVTNVNHERVMFNDVFRHELRMYRLHPNNFDFLLAARTLATPSEQFRKAVVLKGVIADEASPKDSAYLITVFNFIMNDREEDDGVEETFLEFIMRDMQSIYQTHIQG
ncbi:MAG: hypothetical protein ACOH5I_03140 [Oligoflexus sp.]